MSKKTRHPRTAQVEPPWGYPVPVRPTNPVKVANVTASIELIMPVLDRPFTDTDVLDALKQAILGGQWVHVANPRISYIREE